MTNQQLQKTTKRLYPIALNGFRTILNPLIAIAFSYIIVRFFSKEIWGKFVEYMLFFFIASVVTNWGNKTYLMRVFSQNPKNIIVDWQEFFLARISLCAIFAVTIFFLYPLHQIVFLILWLLCSFIYNSFLVIIYYNRDYIKSIFIEIAGFFALVIQLYFLKNNLNIDLLIRSYAICIVIKVMIAIIYYYKFLNFKEIKLNFSILKLSLPFFLLGISGFLQSKIDVYAYRIFYSGKLLGEYQIISGFFIFSQSVVMLLMFPYVKNIYRMSTNSINTLKKGIMIYGFILNAIIVTGISFTLLFFEIRLSLFQLILGFLIGYPCYIYTIDILIYFKTFKEKTVISISVISLVINFVLSILFLYLGYNVTGVLTANAIAQIFALSCYLWLRTKGNVISLSN